MTGGPPEAIWLYGLDGESVTAGARLPLRAANLGGGHGVLGMVWYGMVWYGIIWYGMVWYGRVFYVMVGHGIPCGWYIFDLSH